MTLDEAIKHCEYKAEELKKKAEFAEKEGNYRKEDCLECARDHEQLAEWLKELKAYKECPYIQDECSGCGGCEGKSVWSGDVKNENN